MRRIQERLLAAIQGIKDRDEVLDRELQAKRDRATRDTTAGIVNETALEGMDESRADLVAETIVLRTGRPVLAVSNDEPKLDFRDAESEVWRERLVKARSRLIPAIRAVGRIELQNNPRYSWVGTGWLVRPDIIVTNRHVALEFGKSSGSGFVFRLGVPEQMEASIDFLEEFGRTNSLTFRLRKILHIESDDGPDVAFLQVEGSGLAEPVRLSATAPAVDQFVAVIGYPARDSRIPDQQLVESIFGNIFDKKRLAPGQVTGSDPRRLLHDCSTAGGNSGSLVFDLITGNAIGLHFAGRFLEANFAVPANVIEERLKRLERRESTSAVLPAGPVAAVSTGTAKHRSDASRSSITYTIPIHIRVDIGQPDHGVQHIGVTAPAGKSGETQDTLLAEAPPESYANRKGYDPQFLADAEAPLPTIIRDAGKILTFEYEGKTESELRYEHFSVVMNRERRMCFFSAVNIDGKQSRKGKRPGWRWDSRIPKPFQIKDECYGDAPKFSRGHMTRREDPVWGAPASAALGNEDSMHVTNAVPQMQPFNAGIWLGLEDYALDNAREDDMRICVITGPILRQKDPVLFEVKVPVDFWKIIVFIHDQTKRLCATGYSMSQQDFLREEEFVFGQHKTHQRSLAWIENEAGMDFGALTEHDPFVDEEETLPAPLTDFNQIRFA